MARKIFTAVFASFFLNILLINNVLATDSALSRGLWYKLSVDHTGMYSLSYAELASMGVDVNNIDPRNIKIYHNGGGVLPVLNSAQRPSDLVEIPILIYGESDGHFNDGDLIVFYARGPVVWKYNALKGYYEHQNNPYSDYSSVFLTIGENKGKRIETDSKPTGSTVEVNDFLDGACYDREEVNLINAGCTWYFDRFDITLSRSYAFTFDNVVTTKKAMMMSEIASRNFSPTTFKFTLGSTLIASLKPNTMSSTTSAYAQSVSTEVKQFDVQSSTFDITATYERSSTSSVAWLNYISVNAWRRLAMSGDVMAFRNPQCTDPAAIYEYKLTNAGGSTQVWNVTNPTEPRKVEASISASTLSFNAKGERNSEYIAFNGNSFSKATFAGTVANQNLHAMKDVDYLIITHSDFASQAERLKNIHSQIDSLVVEIVELQQIYNEFSCGSQDITGIRDFVKYLHDNNTGEHQLKYVLLLGDASYAYKKPEVCFIPSYESKASCSINNSMVTDDFYVSLDPNEGDMESKSVIDLAIGRMPVSTIEQATIAIDKIEQFLEKDEKTMNKWRNVITLVCDDEERGGVFLKYSENIANSLQKWGGGDMVVDKIYLDAYEQIATASGQRCPEVNEAITNRIENGTLIFNYIGHGGEIGLSDERILTMDDIKSWKNIPMLPVFITATCEFSRFDDHTRNSAGELVYQIPTGGAINMVTTTRATQSTTNQAIETRFYDSFFKMYGGEYQRIGDIFKDAKQSDEKMVKYYTLFGDPALRIAYPKNNVVLTKLNGKEIGIQPLDTLKALSTIELEGEVRDNFNCLMDDFNGIVEITVFDKENTYTTHGDHGYEPEDFNLRDSKVFIGKTTVENGIFKSKFTLPKDIKYNYGNSLISMYATDYQTDANGSNSDIIIGGYDENVIPDEDGPEVRLFIDDTLFVSGGITNENPVLIAKIRDPKGINTSGAGIGHDIIATLTGATEKSYNLNNYYDAPLSLDEFGNLTYRLYSLNNGQHNLKLRVWDIFNNSTTVSIDFTVVKSGDGTLAVENLINVPNPMVNETEIMFEHNQKGPIDVRVRIFNINGQLVRTIEEWRDGESMRVAPIVWDGTSDCGAAMPSGIYIYNVTVSNDKNETASGFSKLVIAR